MDLPTDVSAPSAPDGDIVDVVRAHPSGSPWKVPTSAEDWDAMKPAIEELYLKKNLALPDVVETMKSSYMFKATPKMYKDRFNKWKWHKYRTKERDSVAYSRGRTSSRAASRPSTNPPALGERQHLGRRVDLSRRLLESDDSHELVSILSGYRRAIRGWSEQDPRSQTASPFHKVDGYNPAMITYFFLGFEHLHKGENKDGGRALRSAFLEAEALVLDGHLNTIWDCCVTVPQMALTYGRKDVLLPFLRFLAGICSIKARSHPISIISRSLLAFAEKNFEQLHHFTHSSWRFWVDTITAVLGKDNINTLNIKRAFLLVSTKPNQADVNDMIADYDRLVDKAVADLGGRSTMALTLEFDALSSRARFSTPGPDFAARVEDVLSRLCSKPCNLDIKPESWQFQDRQMYRGCCYLLEGYLESTGDAERARVYRDMFLAAPSEGDWVQYALRMESRLRLAEKDSEADRVKAHRLEVQLPEKIVKALEAEEGELEELP